MGALRVKGERGALALGALWLLAAATAGAGVGIGLGASGGIDLVRDTSVLGADAVAFHDCPDGTEVGDFHRGDRAYATGRSDDGDWLEVRSPQDPSARVWVEARYTVSDRSTDSLAVVTCAAEELVALGGTDVVPESEVTEPPEVAGTTTTTLSAAPGAPAPGPSAESAAPAPAPAPAPGPTDTTPPTIGQLTGLPGQIQETGCSGATQAQVTSSVTDDDSGVASVTIAWSVGSASGSKSGTVAVVGAFPETTLSETGSSQPIAFTVSATDNAGNSAEATFSNVVTLKNCP